MSVPLGEYMTATAHPRVGKRVTDIFTITDRHGGILGSIEWYGAWRQYVFCPEMTTAPVFNPDCLTRLAAFAALCTREHRIAKRPSAQEDDGTRTVHLDMSGLSPSLAQSGEVKE